MTKIAPLEAAGIYAHQLVGRGYGLPLWYPDQTQAELGDVGFIDHGCFYSIFNIFRPQDDPLNSKGVPEGFTPLNIPPHQIRRNKRYLEPGFISSDSLNMIGGEIGGGTVGYVHLVGYTVKWLRLCLKNSLRRALFDIDVSYSYHCSGRRGAIAYLQDCAEQEQIVRSLQMRKYALENHESWYAFARKIGCDVRRKDVILVSGCIRTSSWAGLCWASEAGSHGVNLSASIGGMPGVRFKVSCARDAGIRVDERATPPDQARSCVFLKYYKLKHAGSRIRRGIRATPRASDAVPEEDFVDVRCWPMKRRSLHIQLDLIRAGSEWISRVLRGPGRSLEIRSAHRAPMLGMVISQASSSAGPRDAAGRSEEEDDDDDEVSTKSFQAHETHFLCKVRGSFRRFIKLYPRGSFHRFTHRQLR